MSEFRGRDGQTIWQICATQMHSPGGSTSTGQYKTFSLILVNLLKHNQNYYLTTWHFDLYQRPSSEEAGTQFFQFLTQREDAVSTQPKRTNWSQATVIDREPERFTRWIKEAIHIRNEGQQATNRDEGSYQLSHAYDHFFDTRSSRRVKNLPVVSRTGRTEYQLLLIKASDRGRNVKLLGNNFGCVWVN